MFEALERIHARAAKIIYGLDWDTPTTQVLATTNWRSLKHTYIFKMLCLVYNCYYGLVPIPLQDLFIKRLRIYNFRKTNCLKPPKPNLDYIKKSIAYQGATIWNSLDNGTRVAENLFLNVISKCPKL